uniref:NRL4 n=1 Tax=Arundo donax TaxID=35708 RepID=A0A0A9F2I7_ARUDO
MSHGSQRMHTAEFNSHRYSVGLSNTAALCRWSLLSSIRERHGELRLVIHHQTQDLWSSVVAHYVEIKLGSDNFAQLKVGCNQCLSIVVGTCQNCSGWRNDDTTSRANNGVWRRLLI